MMSENDDEGDGGDHDVSELSEVKIPIDATCCPWWLEELCRPERWMIVEMKLGGLMKLLVVA